MGPGNADTHWLGDFHTCPDAFQKIADGDMLFCFVCKLHAADFPHTLLVW